MEHKTNHIYNVLKEAVSILNTATDLFSETCENMRVVDLETTDIHHELEFCDFDEEKAFSLLNELKQIRKNRRIIKEDQAVLSYLKSFIEKNNTFAKRLEEVVEQMGQEIDARQSRIYVPKIRTDKMEVIQSAQAITLTEENLTSA